MMLHVERATPEDLPGIWAVATHIDTGNNDRGELFHAVQSQNCLIAKSGWEIWGYAVRENNFFGYPRIAILATHPHHRRQGVARALMSYAEKTTPADRLFISAAESNHAALSTLNTLGYIACGEIAHLKPNEERELFFYKMLQ